MNRHVAVCSPLMMMRRWWTPWLMVIIYIFCITLLFFSTTITWITMEQHMIVRMMQQCGTMIMDYYTNLLVHSKSNSSGSLGFAHPVYGIQVVQSCSGLVGPCLATHNSPPSSSVIRVYYYHITYDLLLDFHDSVDRFSARLRHWRSHLNNFPNKKNSKRK